MASQLNHSAAWRVLKCFVGVGRRDDREGRDDHAAPQDGILVKNMHLPSGAMELQRFDFIKV